MTSRAPKLGVSVAITNTGLGASKRGVAVELALRIAWLRESEVCLVGADPTDRDVERRLTSLMAGGDYSRTHMSEGPHSVDVTLVPHRRLCVVSLSDRTAAESVLPRLRERFELVVVDGPSRIGNGIGISRMLLPHLDGLVIASDLAARDLALTRRYLDTLAVMSRAHRVDVGVIVTGHEFDSGLAPAQIESRLSELPVIGRVPRLWGRVTRAPELNSVVVDAAFEPVIKWIIAMRANRSGAEAPDLPDDAPAQVAELVHSTRPARALSAAERYWQGALSAHGDGEPGGPE
jgi:hypothetical protein